MRVTTAFKRLLRLPGVNVASVAFRPAAVEVTVSLRRRRLVCPCCACSTRARYDSRPVASDWRHLDLGAWRLEVRASPRRLACPTQGVRTEAVSFARAGSGFTTDFEDLVGYLATTMDKTAICRLVRIDWDTVLSRMRGAEPRSPPGRPPEPGSRRPRSRSPETPRCEPPTHPPPAATRCGRRQADPNGHPSAGRQAPRCGSPTSPASAPPSSPPPGRSVGRRGSAPLAAACTPRGSPARPSDESPRRPHRLPSGRSWRH